MQESPIFLLLQQLQMHPENSFLELLSLPRTGLQGACQAAVRGERLGS